MSGASTFYADAMRAWDVEDAFRRFEREHERHHLKTLYVFAPGVTLATVDRLAERFAPDAWRARVNGARVPGWRAPTLRNLTDRPQKSEDR